MYLSRIFVPTSKTHSIKKRTAKRVTGDTAGGDNNSGVAVVRHDSGIRVGVANATAAKAMRAVKSMSEQSAGGAEAIASSRKSTEKGDSLSLNSQADFTVGDMSFATNPAT